MDVDLDKSMFDWDKKFKDQLPSDSVEYISALDVLCNDDGCITSVGDSAKDLAAADWGHLTPASSVYFIDQISSKLMR